ncbi:VOC family protein [Streptosporangium sp. NPDC000396]|uniref:VOC family protein n=1 Tax=Streptosporangium sp. NPDC000396 TaxID=3366185 RepID=UPI003694C77C
MPVQLRIELFVADLVAFLDFYQRVLGFTAVQADTGSGYAAVRRDGVRIGAALAWRPVDRAARSVPDGTEIVIEVDDVRAERDRVIAAGWPLAEDLKLRPWGLTDFRVHDPDGYYLRFTDTS